MLPKLNLVLNLVIHLVLNLDLNLLLVLNLPLNPLPNLPPNPLLNLLPLKVNTPLIPLNITFGDKEISKLKFMT